MILAMMTAIDDIESSSLSLTRIGALVFDMSLLRRALRSVGIRVGKDRYLVGTDLEGADVVLIISLAPRPIGRASSPFGTRVSLVGYQATRSTSDLIPNSLVCLLVSSLARGSHVFRPSDETS